MRIKYSIKIKYSNNIQTLSLTICNGYKAGIGPLEEVSKGIESRRPKDWKLQAKVLEHLNIIRILN